MSVTPFDLLCQCELIQNDLICILDGLDKQTIDNVCQVIIDRFKILENKWSE